MQFETVQRENMSKLIPTTLKIEAELSGTLIRRYKRFSRRH